MTRTVLSFEPEGLKKFLHGLRRDVDDLKRLGEWNYDTEVETCCGEAQSVTVTLYIDDVAVASASGPLGEQFTSATMFLGHLSSAGTAGTFTYDAASVVRDTAELLGNVGFESALLTADNSTAIALGNWRPYRPDAAAAFAPSLVASPVHGGASALRVVTSGGSDDNRYVFQDITVSSTAPFDVEAEVYPSSGSQHMGLFFNWDRGISGGSDAQAIVTMSPTATSFSAFGLTGTGPAIPTGTWSNVRLHIETSTDASIGGLADVDTVTIPPSGGQTLIYNITTGQWEPGDINGADAGTLATFDLIDDAAPQSLYLNEPQAIYDAAADRTYFAWMDDVRDLNVSMFDHTTGRQSDPVVIDTYPLTADNDHGGLCLAIDHDGYLHIVWGSHNTAHQYLRSTAPRDISAWTTTSLSEVGTYPFLVVADNNDLLLFDRRGPGTDVRYFAVRRSTDGGSTFAARTDVIDVGGASGAPVAYVFSVKQLDGLVHLTWTIGDSVTFARQNVYHAVYDPATGTMSNLAGTDLGTTITWAEHPDCLVYTGTNIWNITSTVVADDEIYAVFHVGTDGTGEEGTYTVRVAKWNGTAWSVADTGAPTVWRYSRHVVTPHGDGLLGLFATRTATRNDLTAWISPDAVTWTEAGVVLEGLEGEGWAAAEALNDGPWLAVAQGMPTDWSRDPADGTPAIAVITRPEALGAHDHAADLAAHNADPDAHPDLEIDLPDETVFAPAYTVTDGTTLDLAVTFVWGIDATGDPYYNSAGVTAGEEAVLVLDNTTGSLSLRPVEV